MARQVTTEQNLDRGQAFSFVSSSIDLQHLWTMNNMRRLNSDTGFGQQDRLIRSNGVIASGADGFTLCEEKQLIAAKHDQTEKLQPLHEQTKHEKLIPRDGESLTIKQLLSDYKTPFTDAYERSKHLKPGQPGKSKALEALIDRLKTCPWAARVHIQFDSKANNPDYSNAESTITIRPQDPPWKQIDDFAHESFHASNQALSQLYLKGPIKDPKAYAEVLAKLEIGSFMAEIAVHKELTQFMSGAGTVTYEWRDKNRIAQPTMDLSALYERSGEAGLTKFIIDNAFTKMVINDKFELSNYRNYYEKCHDKYLTGYEDSMRKFAEWIKRDPKVKE